MKKEKIFSRASILTALFVSLPRVIYGQEASTDQAKAMFSPNVETAKKLLDMFIEFCVKYSLQALGGILVFILGIIIAKIAGRMFGQFLERHKVDITVSKFLAQALKITIIALAALIALGNFGITIAPFIAGLSVAGFGLSFALQGPLSNYAAGATLIFTKPFKVGDIIEVADAAGEVTDITLARTEVMTVDGTLIVIPNKHIIGEVIHNYSEFKKLDIKVGISYASDVDKAIDILKNIIRKDARVAAKPQPKVGISEFADSSINLYARIWCRQIDYWDLMFLINNEINKQFKQYGVAIPFPQRDVHIYENK